MGIDTDPAALIQGSSSSSVRLFLLLKSCHLLTDRNQLITNLLEQMEPFKAKYKRRWPKGSGANLDFCLERVT